MKKNQIITAIAATTLLAISTSPLHAKLNSKAKVKNLVENGTFSKSKLKLWLVGITKKYGHELKHKVTKKTIHFKGIKGLSPKYITLGQYVDIQKGKAYQVSFDTMTPSMKGKFTFNIGRPGFARLITKNRDYDHLHSKLELSKDWKTTTFNFTGGYDTDNKNYAGRKVNGMKEKKVWEKLDPQPGTNTKAKIGPTWIVFNLGELTGDCHIRNVVITEVAAEAKKQGAEQAKEDAKEKDDTAKDLTKEEKKAARKAARKAAKDKEKAAKE